MQFNFTPFRNNLICTWSPQNTKEASTWMNVPIKLTILIKQWPWIATKTKRPASFPIHSVPLLFGFYVPSVHFGLFTLCSRVYFPEFVSVVFHSHAHTQKTQIFTLSTRRKMLPGREIAMICVLSCLDLVIWEKELFISNVSNENVFIYLRLESSWCWNQRHFFVHVPVTTCNDLLLCHKYPSWVLSVYTNSYILFWIRCVCFFQRIKYSEY